MVQHVWVSMPGVQVKRRRTIYDYCRRYRNGKFIGWEVLKILPTKPVVEDVGVVALFYGPKGKTNAQMFTKLLNQERVQ